VARAAVAVGQYISKRHFVVFSVQNHTFLSPIQIGFSAFKSHSRFYFAKANSAVPSKS